MRAWYSPIVLELAYLGGCTNFMSSLPAQEAIESMWTGNIHCSPLAIFFCMLLPFLLYVPQLVQFGKTELFSLSYNRDTNGCLNYRVRQYLIGFEEASQLGEQQASVALKDTDDEQSED
ncbi:unnamed protein product [Dibothriocephalus latus]|uniref:Uncharacterized protein n=1 Tax=Dibothriocephalus latus TaxID=60516 RepID=A0A3P7LFR2_DIBLA|nr:unnamed protein product [Dibothriocephalus latus]